MATDYVPDPFDQWSEGAQERWLDMAERSGSRRVANDPALQNFYDIAFNTPRGEITGAHRDKIIEAMEGYVQYRYGFSLRETFDWRDWREWYSAQ